MLNELYLYGKIDILKKLTTGYGDQLRNEENPHFLMTASFEKIVGCIYIICVYKGGERNDKTKAGNGAYASLAVLSELFILTDIISGWISSLITSDFIYQRIVTLVIVYGFWISGILIIRKLYQNNKLLHFSHTEMPTAKHLLFGLLLLAISFTVSYTRWNGFKVFEELMGQ